ncbi:SAVED domain-containing protein [Bosea sp. 2RAB26]|uniref:SAVED domain-containing protein n=1 Tax=Bosea sp. 2RAB26 TaxID=3237476 RepID=UPI003F8E618E
MVALKLGVSATVSSERIEAVFGAETLIWSIAAATPGNDVMRRPRDLVSYRAVLRRAFDRIEASHGEGATIHIFSAVPVSFAVETGRAWMPRATCRCESTTRTGNVEVSSRSLRSSTLDRICAAPRATAWASLPDRDTTDELPSACV